MRAAKPCEPYSRNDDQEEGQQGNEVRLDDKPGVAACIRENVSDRSARRVYRDGGQENRQSQHGKDDQRKQDDADDDFRAIGWCDGQGRSDAHGVVSPFCGSALKSIMNGGLPASKGQYPVCLPIS